LYKFPENNQNVNNILGHTKLTDVMLYGLVTVTFVMISAEA